MKNKHTKKKRDPQLKGFHLVPDTAGIILNGIFVKDDDGSGEFEIIIKSAFGGQWIFRPLKENEKSL